MIGLLFGLLTAWLFVELWWRWPAIQAKVSLRKIPRDGDREYLDRYGLGEQTREQSREDRRTGAWRARIHHFRGPDGSGHHNHPFKWAFSIVLWGSYTEEVLEFVPCPVPWPKCHLGRCICCQGTGEAAKIVARRVRLFNWIPSGKFHRITKLHGDVWTLFITGPRITSWGFIQNGEYLPWEEHNRRYNSTGREGD